jgi:hypothetical protein
MHILDGREVVQQKADYVRFHRSSSDMKHVLGFSRRINSKLYELGDNLLRDYCARWIGRMLPLSTVSMLAPNFDRSRVSIPSLPCAKALGQE